MARSMRRTLGMSMVNGFSTITSAAGVKGPHHQVGVGVVGSGDDEPVDALLGDHALELLWRVAAGNRPPRCAGTAFVRVEPPGVGVAPRHQFCQVGVFSPARAWM